MSEQQNITILVVDDSAGDRALVSSLVRHAGWEIICAEDGKQGLQQLERTMPDAVLTDLRMPQMDGLQFVREARGTHPQVPVILMTAFGSEDIAAEALRIGAASYIPKKDLAKHLEDTLRKVLATILSRRATPLVTLLHSHESHFVLGYESQSLVTLVNYQQACLGHLDFGDEAELIRIGMALTEALNNAIGHGNLELESSLRDSEQGEYERIRSERMQSLPYRDRQVFVTQRLTPAEAEFVIRDEGVGFDPAQLPDPTDSANLTKTNGRGLLMIRTFMDEVLFNSIGNEITMRKRRQAAC